MKITKVQLRKIILKEIRDTMSDQYSFDSLIAGGGSGNLPPVDNRPRGGGDGPKPCDFGQPKHDRTYERVFYTFGNWVDANFPGEFPFDNYLNHLITKLGIEMDELSDEYNEFFKMLMEVMAIYACNMNIKNLEDIYKDPRKAIRYQNYL